MERMFWLDMEMTGLDVDKERILEVALIVTDVNFKVLKTFDTAVYQPKELLDAMDPWCKEHHGGSGLVARSATGMQEPELDDTLFQIGKEFCSKGKIILCGNSIAQDRKFIDKYLPRFASLLHYRMLDVSSFKLIFENVFNIKFKKENKHQALEDIRESMAELAFYYGYLDAAKLGRPTPTLT